MVRIFLFLFSHLAFSNSLRSMNYSMQGLPVLHNLWEFAQTHVHWVSDAIQPSHPLSSPSPPALNLSSIRVFSDELALRIRWPKYWSFSFNISPSDEYSGLISFRMHRLALLAVLLDLNKKLHSVFPSPKWTGESDQGGQGPGLEAVHSVLRAQCPGLAEPPRGHQLSLH